MFDLQANLNPLFNWNAKQLFVFLMAEYETVDNKLNQVIILQLFHHFKGLNHILAPLRLFYGIKLFREERMPILS